MRKTGVMGLAAFTAALAVMGGACVNRPDVQGDRTLIPTLSSTLPAGGGSVTSPSPRVTVTPDGVFESTAPPIMNVSTREWRETNFRRYTVDPQQIISGGPGKDGVAPIYQPLFVSAGQSALWQWMTPNHPVVVVDIDGDARAYPLALLTMHEVVNDIVGGTPLVVTYSPLTYMPIAFERTVGNTVLEFGTTGNVRLSNGILWDDHTVSWWQQATGEAIFGDAAGQRLTPVQTYITSITEFKDAYPNGRVLSPESMPLLYQNAYGYTPYAKYDGPNSRPFLFLDPMDDRLWPTERVLVLQTGSAQTAFPFLALTQNPVIQTTVDGVEAVIFYKRGTLSALDEEEILKSRDVGSAAAFDPRLEGRTLTFKSVDGVITDNETGSTWSVLGKALAGELAGAQLDPLATRVSFWFSWAAFWPETQVYRPV